MDVLGDIIFFKASKFDGTKNMWCVELFIRLFIIASKIQSKHNAITPKPKTKLKLKC